MDNVKPGVAYDISCLVNFPWKRQILKLYLPLLVYCLVTDAVVETWVPNDISSLQSRTEWVEQCCLGGWYVFCWISFSARQRKVWSLTNMDYMYKVANRDIMGHVRLRTLTTNPSIGLYWQRWARRCDWAPWDIFR